jgi:hypothetical protein
MIASDSRVCQRRVSDDVDSEVIDLVASVASGRRGRATSLSYLPTHTKLGKVRTSDKSAAGQVPVVFIYRSLTRGGQSMLKYLLVLGGSGLLLALTATPAITRASTGFVRIPVVM